MTIPQLPNKTLDEWLAEVQGLQTVGDANQVRSVMAVVAKSALELTTGLAAAATEVRRLTDTTATFNEGAGKLTEQLVRLNRSLTWATWVIARGTALLVLVAILTAHSAP